MPCKKALRERVPPLQYCFSQSLLTFGSIVFVIGIGLFVLNVSLHSIMLICLSIAAISAWQLKKGDFKGIRDAMNEGISRAFSAIYIFLLIGVLIELIMYQYFAALSLHGY